jgi:hypothetical protein
MLITCLLIASTVIIIGCKGPTGPTGAQGPSGNGYTNLWEDFESNTFTTYPWQLSGNSNWQIVSDHAMFGLHSACSGTITNSQTSTLSIQVNLPTASICSFYCNISSELHYDGLIWLIDGYAINSASGISNGFYPETFAIPPGQHTIAWTYAKDASFSSGSDKAWVDGILITDYALANQQSSSTLTNNTLPTGVGRMKHYPKHIDFK